jgi:biopolymer transport protein ExbB
MALTAAQPRPRLAVLFAACLLGFLLSGSVPLLAPAARAEDGEEKKEDKPAAKPEKKSHSFKEIFLHIVKSVGWVFGGVLLFVSIALLALIVLLAMELRMGAAIPPGFVEDFTDVVNKRRFKEAYEIAREDGSFLGRVLTTGMSRLQYGIEDAREAAFAMVESLKAGKEQLVVYLATIGTLGPLLGLVGTVWGMILAFMSLATSTQMNPQELADAISHALVVTLLGIGLSVPAIFFHAFFRNRLIRVAHDTGTVADDLLTQMYHNSKKPGAAAAEVPEVRPVATAATAGVKQK